MWSANCRSTHKGELRKPREKRTLIGHAVRHANVGWIFIPAEGMRRKRSRKHSTSAEDCIPNWVKKDFPQHDLKKDF